jgi:hypothetical protein
MKIFKYQLWHFLSLVILLAIMIFFINRDEVDILYGGLWHIETYIWLIAAILAPIAHQLYVVICWRVELYYQGISRIFGKKTGFVLYKIGFVILILLRPITITILAISNEGTLYIDPYIAYALAAIFSIVVIYLFYSVKKYFGMDRAFGIDHFEPEKAKELPMVKKGIFKYTDNGMYEYGFLILWIPGLIFLSKAALMVALFQHIYIWIHFYFTELPDMKVIYGKKK